MIRVLIVMIRPNLCCSTMCSTWSSSRDCGPIPGTSNARVHVPSHAQCGYPLLLVPLASLSYSADEHAQGSCTMGACRGTIVLARAQAWHVVHVQRFERRCVECACVCDCAHVARYVRVSACACGCWEWSGFEHGMAEYRCWFVQDIVSMFNGGKAAATNNRSPAPLRGLRLATPPSPPPLRRNRAASFAGAVQCGRAQCPEWLSQAGWQSSLQMSCAAWCAPSSSRLPSASACLLPSRIDCFDSGGYINKRRASLDQGALGAAPSPPLPARAMSTRRAAHASARPATSA